VLALRWLKNQRRMYLIIQFQFIALKHTNKVYEESKVGHNILP